MPEYIAPGKMFLSGEYSVLYGHPAIVLSINKYVRVNISRSNEFSISIYNKTYTGSYNSLKQTIRKLSPHTYHVLSYVDNLFGLDNLKIEIKSDIPFKGLGSSSAILTALLYGLLDFLNEKISKHKLIPILYNIKKNLEGGSPADIIASTFGGISLVKYSEEKITYTQLKKDYFSSKAIKLIAIYSGKSVKTKDVIDRVMDSIKMTNYKKSIIDLISKITGEIWQILHFNGEPSKLIRLIRLNHFLLSSLGISTTFIDDIVNNLYELPNVALKISGAGFGDSILMLIINPSKETLTQISQKISPRQYTHIKVDIGGVRKVYT